MAEQCLTEAGHQALVVFVNQVSGYLAGSGNFVGAVFDAQQYLEQFLFGPLLHVRHATMSLQEFIGHVQTLESAFPGARSQIQDIFSNVLQPLIDSNQLPYVISPLTLPDASYCAIFSKIGNDVTYSDLPKDVVLEIFKKMPVKQLLMVAQLDRKSKELTRSNVLWRERYNMLENDETFQRIARNKSLPAINVWNKRDNLTSNGDNEFFYNRFRRLWFSFVHYYPPSTFIAYDIKQYSKTLHPNKEFKLPHYDVELDSKTITSFGRVPSIPQIEIVNDGFYRLEMNGQSRALSTEPIIDAEGDMTYLFNENDTVFEYNPTSPYPRVRSVQPSLHFTLSFDPPEKFFVVFYRDSAPGDATVVIFKLQRKYAIGNFYGLLQGEYKIDSEVGVWDHTASPILLQSKCVMCSSPDVAFKCICSQNITLCSSLDCHQVHLQKH